MKQALKSPLIVGLAVVAGLALQQLAPWLYAPLCGGSVLI